MDATIWPSLAGAGAAGHRQPTSGIAGDWTPPFHAFVAPLPALPVRRRTELAEPLLHRRCPSCWDTGVRTVYGRGGKAMFSQPCPCYAGLLWRLEDGLRRLSPLPTEPPRRAI